MLRFALRRALGALFTLWLAATLAFIALRLAPSDAITLQLTLSGATESQIAARRAALGLELPIGVQYLSMLSGLLRGDLGVSLVNGRAVTALIAEQLDSTLALAFGALMIGTLLGIMLGIGAALGRAAPRKLCEGLIALTLATPIYWLGTIAIYVFAVWLGILPSVSRGNSLQALILPCGVLGVSLSGSIGQVTAAALREARNATFVQLARAKGLPERLIVWRHMLRAYGGALISLIGLQAGFLIGGAVVTEALFTRRGIGQLLLNAVNGRDYPVVQGVVLLSALAYSLLSTLTDILAAWRDPRLQTS
ncbi:MAG: glutathione ABC transporter permease GsiC [Candidatus Thermofonsia Clade 1 bacterium]|uniref:Glutathione ABC transporter permease GsiC n=1 Tax=Candidatus Thermofonsia Clade 1 bacterium TaxID=2364210 RepID=A0A2M8P2L5_9CHLR|nr:MAG: glutathione ABC transporter permease GsiC [Candidatus Thermofonsia Clade 1 bacterium]